MPEAVNLGFDLNAEPAVASIDRLGKSAETAAASTDKLARAGTGLSRAQQELITKSERVAATGSSIDIQNRKAVNSYLQQVAQVRALAAQMGILADVESRTSRAATEAASHLAAETAAMKALRVETGLAASARGALGTAAGVSASGLNSMRASVTSLAASMLGAAPGVTQFTSVLGTMAIGSGLMIGVMAGMAALAFLWDKLTESARKSKEEHEQAIKVLDDFRKKQDQGPAGAIGESTAVRQKDLADQIRLVRQLEGEQRALAAIKPTGEAAQGIALEKASVDRRLAIARAAVIDLQDVVRRGNAETARLNKEDANQRQQQDASALTARLDFNQKDAAARRAALDQLKKDRVEYARLLKLPETADNSKEIARIASEMKTLDDALNPKAKRVPKSQDTKDMEAITAVLREQEEQAQRTDEARTKAVADATSATQQQLAESELLLAAIRESEGAYKAQQREIAILNQLTAEGVRLGDADYETQKRRAEQLYDTRSAIDAVAEARKTEADAAKRAADDAERDMERRARQFGRTISSAVSGALDSLGEKGANFFQTWWDAGKRGLNRFIGDAVGSFATQKFGEAFGIGPGAAAAKQITAGATMLTAAQLQVAAANAMLSAIGLPSMGAAAGIAGSGAMATTAGGASLGAIGLGIGAAGAAGALVGHGVGSSLYSQSHGAFGNYARGAIGGGLAGAGAGAAAGAAIGALGGPITALGGAIVGAVTGVIGGLLGMGSAAKEAAKQTREMRAALVLTMDGLRAEVGKDATAASIAQVNAQREQIRKQIEDAYSGGGANSDTVRERNRQLAELNKLEDERIRQLREEAAVMATRRIEDYRARLDAATPGNERAEAIAAFNRTGDRELEDLKRSFGDDIDAQEAATYAMAQQAIAAEKARFATDQNTAAVNGLTTTMRGAPSGFKTEDLNRLIQQHAKAMPIPGSVPINPLPMPVNPFAPPTLPLSPSAPSLSQMSATSASPAPVFITMPGAVFQIDGNESGEAILGKIAAAIDDVKERALGGSKSITRAQALERVSAQRAQRRTFS